MLPLLNSGENQVDGKGQDEEENPECNRDLEIPHPGFQDGGGGEYAGLAFDVSPDHQDRTTFIPDGWEPPTLTRLAKMVDQIDQVALKPQAETS